MTALDRTETPSRLHRRNLTAFLLVCAAGLALNLYMAVQNGTGWGVDFNQFYAASHLAGTGHLYDWEAVRRAQAKHGPEMRSGRLPVVSFGVKLISWLPYEWAHIVWVAASLLALAIFAATWPGTKRPWMLAALCWSMPAALLLVLGQDTPFCLMFFALALRSLKRGKPRLAGVLFALCIAKYHLALGVPVLLLSQKRWKTLEAAALTVAGLVTACYAIEGSGWPRAYLNMLTDPLFSPGPNHMPNLRGLVSRLPMPGAFEVATALVLVFLLWSFCGRHHEPGLAGAAAAACGLLLGHHGYANDMLLLLPLSVLVAGRLAAPKWLKIWGGVLLTPAATLLLVALPFVGQVTAVGFVFAALVLLRENSLYG